MTATLEVPGPPIIARSDWGGDLPPTGPIPAEDVRFLIVHHTSDPGSDYTEGQVPGLLRGIYAFHTSATRGWPDVAYHFFVDRFGRIWEGRTGSLAGPIQGSATGGNQGWTQLCCFLGDHATSPPSAEAQTSMVSLLAWLAEAYDVDTAPGATVSVVSRGSNRHPPGTTIEARTIAAHREMSLTACPGDACYPLVRDEFPARVSLLRLATALPPPTQSPPTQPTPTQPAPTQPAPTQPPTTLPPPTQPPTSTTAPTSTAAPAPSEQASGVPPSDGEGWLVGAGLGGLAAAAAVVVAALRIRARRVRSHEQGG